MTAKSARRMTKLWRKANRGELPTMKEFLFLLYRLDDISEMAHKYRGQPVRREIQQWYDGVIVELQRAAMLMHQGLTIGVPVDTMKKRFVETRL